MTPSLLTKKKKKKNRASHVGVSNVQFPDREVRVFFPGLHFTLIALLGLNLFHLKPIPLFFTGIYNTCVALGIARSPQYIYQLHSPDMM